MIESNQICATINHIRSSNAMPESDQKALASRCSDNLRALIGDRSVAGGCGIIQVSIFSS
jgi:hypothetical protein